MNKVLNFLLRVLEIWQSGKAGKLGSIFLTSGMLLLGTGGVYTFQYSDIDKDISASFGSGNPDMLLYCIGLLLIALGIFILLKTYKKIISEQSLIYFANTLKLGDSKAPVYAMEKNDRVGAVSVYLDLIDSYNKNEVVKDYEYNLKSFKGRIEHKDIHKMYLAALGSAPYLYLLGTLIRNGHMKNEVLDYNRDAGKWYRLDPIGDRLTHSLMNENSNKTIDEKINELCESQAHSVGIALSYTYEVHKESIPIDLQDETLYLTHSLGFGNDKVDNKLSQASLLNELSVYIDKLKSSNKKIHLFISAQASVCINLGKRYQDNTMGEISIYNYDGSDGVRKYDWFITFNKGKVF